VFPECALRALSELDMRSFQGRLLRVSGAKARPPPPDTTASAPTGGGTSSYKRKLQEKQKKVDAHLEHTWNLLYVSANAAADVAAKQLGLSKGDLFGKDATNSAVTSALTETSVIQQTKKWLQREGVRVEAFEQAGQSLSKCRAKAADGADVKRRQDSFIVKHLPAGSSFQELRERFARCGELVRCSAAPSGTVAIVQYVDAAAAKHAFQKLAFSKYMHVPLYLEWAPEDAFVDGAKPPSMTGGEDTKDAAAEADEDDGGQATSSLFVKNLSFATTDATLKAAFKGCKGLRAATVMQKKAAVSAAAKGIGADAKGLSMGYGFIEFASVEDAREAMKRRQGAILEGHAIQLQVSQRGAQGAAGGRASTAVATASKKAAGALTSPRLCVRNLAFEVKNSELRQLFGAYGSITAVRIPKKANYDGHRGFAFIDFASKAEAAAAFEALQHTHLYGRRMVIEAAEETATDVASVQQAASKRQASKGLKSEATKRRRAAVLNTGDKTESFEDAMIG